MSRQRRDEEVMPSAGGDPSSIEDSAKAVLDAIGDSTDLTLVPCHRGGCDELAVAGARELLRGTGYRELDVADLAGARGHTVLLVGDGFSRARHDVMPRALAVAEFRFERVIVLPCPFDPSEDVVHRVLDRTSALVFAGDPESHRLIAPLCDARLAHDCRFYYDYAPFRRPGQGVLNCFRTGAGSTSGWVPPADNHDLCASAKDLPAWLGTIASCEVVRTDRPEILIAAALMDKRVEYAPGGDHTVRALAHSWLSDHDLIALNPPASAAIEQAVLTESEEARLRTLHEVARRDLPRLANRWRSLPEVTAVVVTRDRPGLLARALASLQETGALVHTVVVDNNSAPMNAAAISELCSRYPRTRLDRQERNLLGSGGRARGVELAGSELVLILDDDAELLPGALGHMIAELEDHPEAAAVTATVLRPDGTVFHSGGQLTITDEIVEFSLLGDSLEMPGAELPPSGPSGWAPGTALLTRRQVLRDYPIEPTARPFFDDNEWNVRVARGIPHGFRRSKEALVIHHAYAKPVGGSDFVSRSRTVELLVAYASFYELHGRLLGPWIFDHVAELRAADGSRDVAAARILMELVLSKGGDWTFMAWANGDLAGLLSGRANLLELQAATEAARKEARGLAEQLKAEQAETARLRARAAHDAHTISSLEESTRELARIEASVTWQLFQRVRSRVFEALGGERSRGAEAIQATLRYVGRRLPIAAAVTQAKPRPFRSEIRFPQFEDPEVSIVIPLYSGADLTRAALESIRENTQHVTYEVILVDDAADAETKALLRKVHGARRIVNETNLGYLHSMQKGVSSALGRWIVLCNNDIEVKPGWLAALIDCASSSSNVGIVAPKFIYPNGRLAEAGGIIWRDGTGWNYGRGEDPASCHYEYRRDIDYGSAAALMVRSDLWADLGGFDERFLPMYYEDTDLCFEARARGLRVMFEPAAEVIHVEGGTAGVDLSTGPKRYQEQNRPKFVAKWRERLESEHLPNDPAHVWQAANFRRLPHVLVVDYRIPMWDRESGALRMRGIMASLIQLGCHVTFLPDNLTPRQPYTRELQRLGVEVLYGVDIPGDIKRIGSSISLVILSRPPVAGRWLEMVREHMPGAAVVYDTVDLHWVREARRAAVLAGTEADLSELSPRARAMRELELALVRATDATLVVSDSERAQVLADVPDAAVHVVPNVNEIREHVPDVASREGVVFVGGFEHPPNVDAALMLVNEVMPKVWDRLGAVPVAIVGADAPPEVQALASSLVDVQGWVPGLEPVLDSACALVAPLTYGAGLKGKVTQALAAGLPVVTTPVGAEGLDAVDGEHLVIGTTADELAKQVIRVLSDHDLWRKLSSSGKVLAAERCSPAVMSARLSQLLKETGVVAELASAEQAA